MILKSYMRETLIGSTKFYQLYFHYGIVKIKEKNSSNIVLKKRIHSIIKSIPIIQRLMRMKPRAVLALDNNSFIFSDHVYVYHCSALDKQLIVEHKFSKGMNNPLSFCTRYDENEKLVDVIYGEYIGNGDRGPVSIYKRVSDKKWDKVYTFPSNTIQHIHNIVFDKFRNRYLIMTGDSDNESGIWDADINFKIVKPIVKGSQKYRACVLMPTENYLYYVTDTPLEQNYVYRLDSNGKTQQVSEMPGPCIFGMEKNGYLYFSTSVEGDPTLGRWKYRLSNKLGAGVKDRYSHLFRLSNEGEIEEITKLKKDWLPMWLFEFGNMKFPFSNEEKVYVCPQSLKAKYGTYIIEE